MSVLRRWPSTLKFKIVAMAVASGLLAAAATTHMVLQRSQAAIEQLLLAGAAADREQTAQLLGSKLELMQRSLVAVARSTGPGHWGDRVAMHRHLADKAALGAMFDSVHAVARDGTRLADVDPAQHAAIGAAALPRALLEPVLAQALSTDQPVVSPPGAGPRAPQVLVAMAAAGEVGSAPGVIIGSLPLH
ncbi:MAG: hypothetical protein ACKVQR_11690, partial [Aquabacterium sp.]